MVLKHQVGKIGIHEEDYQEFFFHISQTDNIIILIMGLLKHMLKIMATITNFSNLLLNYGFF
jgi:hypothetical protein